MLARPEGFEPRPTEPTFVWQCSCRLMPTFMPAEPLLGLRCRTGVQRSNGRTAFAALLVGVVASCGSPSVSPAIQERAASSPARASMPAATGSPSIKPAAVPSGPTCAVTTPNGVRAPGEQPDKLSYGEHGIWTSLWPDGTVIVPPENIDPGGVLWMKFPWWRGPRIAGTLVISGREASTGRRISSDVPDGYGQTGFQASGLGFPGPGCYSVTGRVDDAALSFVTQVRIGD